MPTLSTRDIAIFATANVGSNKDEDKSHRILLFFAIWSYAPMSMIFVLGILEMKHTIRLPTMQA